MFQWKDETNQKIVKKCFFFEHLRPWRKIWRKYWKVNLMKSKWDWIKRNWKVRKASVRCQVQRQHLKDIVENDRINQFGDGLALVRNINHNEVCLSRTHTHTDIHRHNVHWVKIVANCIITWYSITFKSKMDQFFFLWKKDRYLKLIIKNWFELREKNLKEINSVNFISQNYKKTAWKKVKFLFYFRKKKHSAIAM